MVGGCGRQGASLGVLSFSLRSLLTEPPSVIDVAYWHEVDLWAVLENVRSCGQNRLSAEHAHHQCAFTTASTHVNPEIIEPVIPISAGTPRGNSKLISEAMKIAATGKIMTK